MFIIIILLYYMYMFQRPMPYKDKDGRVKHIKTIGEEIPEAKPEGY